MSKAAAPCSSCPSSKSEPSGKKKIVYTPNIECVLEDVLPLNSDSTIKVKKFKKFLDYDLKTLNITGELQTYTHKNGFTHTKMVVTYQDKKTKKVDYLEIAVLDNTNKKLDNTNKQSYCADPFEDNSCSFPCYCYNNQCCYQNNSTLCPNSNGVVSGSTAAYSLGATPGTSELLVGTNVTTISVGKNYKLWKQ